MEETINFKPGDLVQARNREWVVLPESGEDLLRLRPLGGAEDDSTLIYLPLESERPKPATFNPPKPDMNGTQAEALLLRDALRLKLRAGAGPFRSFGKINVEPRVYQLVPLLMALKLETIRLLIADDVGIGKTIEAGLIARELIDRGEIERLVVICPPHLCEQWQQELVGKFAIDAEVVRTGTAARLERGLRADESVFEAYNYTVVSLDYIKSDSRRNEFLRACPEFVIVDEAHTCVRGTTNTQSQRYRLLKGLAESKPHRGMVFLTATPHSGDDEAFHNLLGLLDPKFAKLADMPEGDTRKSLRKELALHFVQRRRENIAEWKDNTEFPTRESKETTYQLTDDWGDLFDEVLSYARAMVRRAESGTKLQQRMSWWAALALLRCASSSPAAASLALKTRLKVTEESTDQVQLEILDRAGHKTVMDELADDSLVLTDRIPAGTVDRPKDIAELRKLIIWADELRGSKNDPKLKTLIAEVEKLLLSGFRPVVFCRYIATAHYVGDELKKVLSPKNTHVVVVTGEFTSDQREEHINDLGKLDENTLPVLVATDCLSEGINLQEYFNAVVHYDLTWNPTRHEQREGRADRFGQKSQTVRTLMLYGENNPVDGAVLRVILRKAEKIRKELGVAVPLPTNNNKVIEAIMKTVMLHEGRKSLATQMKLDFEQTEIDVDNAWQTAKNRIKISRTVFDQRRLTPNDVIPEWKKVVSVLGGPDDVDRFVCLSAKQLEASVDKRNGYCRLPVSHFPKPLQDRLETIGFAESAKIVFKQPAPLGATHVHRAHPLVAMLADYVAEKSFDANNNLKIGARTGAIFTKDVKRRTVLYLLRLRSQILVEQRGKNSQYFPLKSLLAEECLGVAVRGDSTPEILTEDQELSLFSLEPDRNMENKQKVHLIQQALDVLPDLEDVFDKIAQKQSLQLYEDHRRIRDASDVKGLRYTVKPSLPVDKIGIYVFMPVVNFNHD